jgi:hypothetical protein
MVDVHDLPVVAVEHEISNDRTPLCRMFYVAMSASLEGRKLGFFGRAQMRLGLAFDAILRLVASRRHELCDQIYASTETRAGIVVHNLPDFEPVISQGPSRSNGTIG